MRSAFDEVLQLQEQWSSKDTEPMRRRGELIRNAIPSSLRKQLDSVKQQMPRLAQDFAVEGRDGTGLKSEIPWCRVYSEILSPSATHGWYLVYLFSAMGDRVYLSLNQGTTRWDGKEYVPRAAANLLARVRWARNELDLAWAEEGLELEIALDVRASRLGAGYERGNVVAIEYKSGELPDDDHLLRDVIRMSSWLSVIYTSAIRAKSSPEFEDAVTGIEQATGNDTRLGQGFRLSPAERRAIKRRALDVVIAHYEGEGFSVRDVSASEPYDLRAQRDARTLAVEVHGSVTRSSEVALAHSEIVAQRALYPNNAFALVHSIDLQKGVVPPIVSGGTLEILSPWNILEESLTPLAYRVATGI